MTTLSKKLERINEIRQEINKLYAELNPLKQEVIKHMVENDMQKEVVKLSETHIATLKWTIEKKIDYEKLQRCYPDVYKMGLKPVFSSTQALNSVSSKLLNKILKDCYNTNMGYKLDIKKRGKQDEKRRK